MDLTKLCKQFKRVQSTFFVKPRSISSKSKSSGPYKGSVADELSYNRENDYEDDVISIRK